MYAKYNMLIIFQIFSGFLTPAHRYSETKLKLRMYFFSASATRKISRTGHATIANEELHAGKNVLFLLLSHVYLKKRKEKKKVMLLIT